MTHVTRFASGAMSWHRPLMWFAVAMSGLAVVSLGGVLFDDRLLIGEPIWAKSLKFSISLALYGVTWSWMYSYLRRGRRWGWWAGTIFTAGAAAEMAAIVTQIVRGTRSHFNIATPFDNAVFQAMTVSISGLMIGHFILGFLLLRERHTDRAVTSAVRIGMAISGLGMLSGFLMTQPTAIQLAMPKPRPERGAHTVGLPDGGPGIPILGWSSVGGDLRIPHFIGLHAMQLLPLLVAVLGFAAARWPRLRDESLRRRLARVAGAGYLGVFALVTWQALRGQSIVRPDALTLGAAAAIAAGVAVAAVLALRGRPEGQISLPLKEEVTVP